MSKIGTLTRTIAIDALTHILTRSSHSDTALQKLFKAFPNLRSLDKAFIYEIVFGSLRWLSKIDWILSHMVNRPLQSLDPRVLNALRIGAYQIYYMDRVPERASVSSTVDAIKSAGVPNAASLVNAILRRVSKKAEYFPKPDKVTDYLNYCAMQYAHPFWMIKRWHEYLSKDQFEHLLVHNNTPPKIAIKQIKKNFVISSDSNFLLSDEKALSNYFLKKFAIGSRFRPLKGALILDSMPRLENCEAFKSGCYIIQQESSQLCCQILPIEADDSVLDACAAPGGKSIFLWEKGVQPENLTVCDISHKRLQLIQENFNRVGLKNAHILRGDVVEVVKDQKFDKILLDAPCSALGVIRRHPEIKWQRTPKDIEICAKKQTYLLEGLAPRLNIGGQLLYVVCSFEPEETYLQIEKFLSKHAEFEVVSLEDKIHDFYRKYVTKRQELVIYGGNPDDLDGFYAVLLKKTGAGS